MKLCRYGPKGTEKPGLADSEGLIRNFSGRVPDFTPETLGEAILELARIDPADLPPVGGTPRYGPPVKGTRKFISIGLNYADHAAESNLPIPDESVIFNKWSNCIQGPNDPVVIPRDSKNTDWEVELGVVIGKRARYVSKDSALAHVAGYTIVNDVSERHWQQERGATWDKGKGFPTSGPVGPWLVTPDEVGGSTATMVFTAAELIAYCSQFMEFEPGDIITTGTPSGVGVGLGQKPEPWYLEAGDVVALGIEKLGQQRQEFVAFDVAVA